MGVLKYLVLFLLFTSCIQHQQENYKSEIVKVEAHFIKDTSTAIFEIKTCGDHSFYLESETRCLVYGDHCDLYTVICCDVKYFKIWKK